MNDLRYDYELHGAPYSTTRQTDPRIAAQIHAALGNARTVLNVGAGTGSYEPTNREVTAIEPSATMRSQRAAHLSVAIDATAESLPFADDSFDASMAVLTLHHWSDPMQGLREMRRVTRGPVVIVTFEIPKLRNLWVTDYAPEIVEIDLLRFPTIEWICNVLEGATVVAPVEVPLDCCDGFLEAFYGRPEAILDERIRRSQSLWGCLPLGVEQRIVSAIEADLASGEWDRRYGYLRTQPSFASSMRIVIAHPA